MGVSAPYWVIGAASGEAETLDPHLKQRPAAAVHRRTLSARVAEMSGYRSITLMRLAMSATPVGRFRSYSQEGRGDDFRDTAVHFVTTPCDPAAPHWTEGDSRHTRIAGQCIEIRGVPCGDGRSPGNVASRGQCCVSLVGSSRAWFGDSDGDVTSVDVVAIQGAD